MIMKKMWGLKCFSYLTLPFYWLALQLSSSHSVGRHAPMLHSWLYTKLLCTVGRIVYFHQLGFWDSLFHACRTVKSLQCKTRVPVAFYVDVGRENARLLGLSPVVPEDQSLSSGIQIWSNQNLSHVDPECVKIFGKFKSRLNCPFR